jgi:hypothetical protein
MSKFKSMGGLPFTIWYDPCVFPVISYGAAIWGAQDLSCTNAVQNRACWFFLGVGKYTPNASTSGYIGWTHVNVRLWKCVIYHWFRLSCMDPCRLNNRVFIWSFSQGSTKCTNWPFRVKQHVDKLGLNDVDLENQEVSRFVVCKLLQRP